MRLTPMELRFVSKAIKFGAKVRGHAKEIVGGTLAGAAVAGAAYGVNRKLASRPLPPPPKTFHMQFEGKGNYGVSVNPRANYELNAPHMTPRLQETIRRHPKKPVWIKFNVKTQKSDKAWSPSAKTAAKAGAIGAGMFILGNAHKWK